VAAGLLAFALWPVAHRVGVAHYHFSPWKFFGWAMYCVPRFVPDVTIYAIEGDQRTKARLRSRSVSSKLDRFRLRREVWGRLAPIDSLVNSIFWELKDVKCIEISVDQRILDTETARIGIRQDVYRFGCEK